MLDHIFIIKNSLININNVTAGHYDEASGKLFLQCVNGEQIVFDPPEAEALWRYLQRNCRVIHMFVKTSIPVKPNTDLGK